MFINLDLLVCLNSISHDVAEYLQKKKMMPYKSSLNAGLAKSLTWSAHSFRISSTSTTNSPSTLRAICFCEKLAVWQSICKKVRGC